MLERDISKFLITTIYAAIIADVLTHGQVAIGLGNIFKGIILGAFQVSAGQRISNTGNVRL